MTRKTFADFMAGRAGRVQAMPIAKTSFAASFYGKQWLDEVTYTECAAALGECGVIPSVIIGEKEYFPPDHPLGFGFKLKHQDAEKKIYECAVSSGMGDITIEQTFIKGQTGVLTRGILSSTDALKKLYSYLLRAQKETRAVADNVSKIRRSAGGNCVIQFFLPQPFELYCLAGREEAIYLRHDGDADFEKVKSASLSLSLKLIEELSAADEVDCFLFGSAGSELYSPDIFDEEFFPASKLIIDAAKRSNVPIIYHACGNMKAFAERTRFFELEPDIIEGMAFPPLGDLLPEHFGGMSEKVILRGNIVLRLLRNGSSADVRAAANELLALLPDRKILLSGACDILYGTPEENIAALNPVISG